MRGRKPVPLEQRVRRGDVPPAVLTHLEELAEASRHVPARLDTAQLVLRQAVSEDARVHVPCLFKELFQHIDERTQVAPRPVLLRKPLEENSNVAAHSAIDPAATADNPILFVADWRQYVVLDRIGMSVEFVPHLFNTTSNLPDGRRGWYAYWRVGGEPLSVAA